MVFLALTGRADAKYVSARSQCASKKTSPQSAYGCLFKIRAALPHTYSYPLSSNLSVLAPINYLTNGAEFDILSERSKDSRYLYGVNPAEDGIIFWLLTASASSDAEVFFMSVNISVEVKNTHA